MHTLRRGHEANKEGMTSLEAENTFQNNVRKVCAQDNPLQVEKAILVKSNKSIGNLSQ